jgi:hypothetical protein
LIGRSDVSGTTLAGAIDDVRLFGSRLAADEIRALFQERG